MSHPDDSTIERFAMGGLDDDAAFIAHVGGCDECSQKLQREAETELAMIEVQALGATRSAEVAEVTEARAPGVTRGRTTLARRAIGPAVAFAAAAAVLVWAGRHRLGLERASSEEPAVQVVTCPDGPTQLDCIAEAHRVGSRLEYPRGTALAALGSEPGLTVYIVPQFSDDVVVEIDAFLAKAKEDLVKCGDQAIVTQNAPVQTGEVGINFSIGPTGRVEESQSTIVLRQGRLFPDPDAPLPGPEAALARCLRTTTHAFSFKATGRAARVSLTAKYVWRE